MNSSRVEVFLARQLPQTSVDVPQVLLTVLHEVVLNHGQFVFQLPDSSIDTLDAGFVAEHPKLDLRSELGDAFDLFEQLLGTDAGAAALGVTGTPELALAVDDCHDFVELEFRREIVLYDFGDAGDYPAEEAHAKLIIINAQNLSYSIPCQLRP